MANRTEAAIGGPITHGLHVGALIPSSPLTCFVPVRLEHKQKANRPPKQQAQQQWQQWQQSERPKATEQGLQGAHGLLTRPNLTRAFVPRLARVYHSIEPAHALDPKDLTFRVVVGSAVPASPGGSDTTDGAGRWTDELVVLAGAVVAFIRCCYFILFF